MRDFAFQIDDLRIPHATALAPMESITDRGFRALIRGMGGCGLTVTEFVSSDLLARDVKRAWRMAELDPDEHPVAIQIYGRDPAKMAAAAAACEGLGADVVDLNLGCPSKQVTSGCSGSALMKEPALAQAIFEAVRRAITVPMTVKMRLGWDDDRRNAVDIARMAEDAGAGMVVVHGRTRMQMYKGEADWQAVGAVKRAVGIPVLVNGDILTVDHAVRALAASGADGVMVGRGAMRDPWVLRRISDHLEGRAPYRPTLAEREAALLQYFDLLHADSNTERRAVGRLKKVTGYFTRGLPHGGALRDTIYHRFSVSEIRDAVHAYFERLAREAIVDGFERVHDDAPTKGGAQDTDSRAFSRRAS